MAFHRFDLPAPRLLARATALGVLAVAFGASAPARAENCDPRGGVCRGGPTGGDCGSAGEECCPNSICDGDSICSGNTCTTPRYVSLGVTLYAQTESNWCWAAGGKMIMGYLGYAVSECAEANEYFNRSDCCTNPSSAACNQPGEPQFSHYGFSSSSTASGTPLTFARIVYEADQNRPVAFRWSWTSGGGHLQVATGGFYVGSAKYVSVDNPLPVGTGDAEDIAYTEYVSGTGYTHYFDTYDITKN